MAPGEELPKEISSYQSYALAHANQNSADLIAKLYQDQQKHQRLRYQLDELLLASAWETFALRYRIWCAEASYKDAYSSVRAHHRALKWKLFRVRINLWFFGGLKKLLEIAFIYFLASMAVVQAGLSGLLFVYLCVHLRAEKA